MDLEKMLLVASTAAMLTWNGNATAAKTSNSNDGKNTLRVEQSAASKWVDFWKVWVDLWNVFSNKYENSDATDVSNSVAKMFEKSREKNWEGGKWLEFDPDEIDDIIWQIKKSCGINDNTENRIRNGLNNSDIARVIKQKLDQEENGKKVNWNPFVKFCEGEVITSPNQYRDFFLTENACGSNGNAWIDMSAVSNWDTVDLPFFDVNYNLHYFNVTVEEGTTFSCTIKTLNEDVSFSIVYPDIDHITAAEMKGLLVSRGGKLCTFDGKVYPGDVVFEFRPTLIGTEVIKYVVDQNFVSNNAADLSRWQEISLERIILTEATLSPVLCKNLWCAVEEIPWKLRELPSVSALRNSLNNEVWKYQYNGVPVHHVAFVKGTNAIRVFDEDGHELWILFDGDVNATAKAEIAKFLEWDPTYQDVDISDLTAQENNISSMSMEDCNKWIKDINTKTTEINTQIGNATKESTDLWSLITKYQSNTDLSEDVNQLILKQTKVNQDITSLSEKQTQLNELSKKILDRKLDLQNDEAINDTIVQLTNHIKPFINKEIPASFSSVPWDDVPSDTIRAWRDRLQKDRFNWNNVWLPFTSLQDSSSLLKMRYERREDFTSNLASLNSNVEMAVKQKEKGDTRYHTAREKSDKLLKSAIDREKYQEIVTTVDLCKKFIDQANAQTDTIRIDTTNAVLNWCKNDLRELEDWNDHTEEIKEIEDLIFKGNAFIDQARTEVTSIRDFDQAFSSFNSVYVQNPDNSNLLITKAEVCNSAFWYFNATLWNGIYDNVEVTRVQENYKDFKTTITTNTQQKIAELPSPENIDHLNYPLYWSKIQDARVWANACIHMFWSCESEQQLIKIEKAYQNAQEVNQRTKNNQTSLVQTQIPDYLKSKVEETWTYADTLSYAMQIALWDTLKTHYTQNCDSLQIPVDSSQIVQIDAKKGIDQQKFDLIADESHVYVACDLWLQKDCRWYSLADWEIYLKAWRLLFEKLPEDPNKAYSPETVAEIVKDMWEHIQDCENTIKDLKAQLSQQETAKQRQNQFVEEWNSKNQNPSFEDLRSLWSDYASLTEEDRIAISETVEQYGDAWKSCISQNQKTLSDFVFSSIPEGLHIVEEITSSTSSKDIQTWSAEYTPVILDVNGNVNTAIRYSQKVGSVLQFFVGKKNFEEEIWECQRAFKDFNGKIEFQKTALADLKNHQTELDEKNNEIYFAECSTDYKEKVTDFYAKYPNKKDIDSTGMYQNYWTILQADKNCQDAANTIGKFWESQTKKVFNYMSTFKDNINFQRDTLDTMQKDVNTMTIFLNNHRSFPDNISELESWKNEFTSYFDPVSLDSTFLTQMNPYWNNKLNYQDVTKKVNSVLSLAREWYKQLVAKISAIQSALNQAKTNENIVENLNDELSHLNLSDEALWKNRETITSLFERYYNPLPDKYKNQVALRENFEDAYKKILNIPNDDFLGTFWNKIKISYDSKTQTCSILNTQEVLQGWNTRGGSVLNGAINIWEVNYNRFPLYYQTSDGVVCPLGYFDTTDIIKQMTIEWQYQYNMRSMTDKINYCTGLMEQADSDFDEKEWRDLLRNLQSEVEWYRGAWADTVEARGKFARFLVDEQLVEYSSNLSLLDAFFKEWGDMDRAIKKVEKELEAKFNDKIADIRKLICENDSVSAVIDENENIVLDKEEVLKMSLPEWRSYFYKRSVNGAQLVITDGLCCFEIPVKFRNENSESGGEWWEGKWWEEGGNVEEGGQEDWWNDINTSVSESDPKKLNIWYYDWEIMNLDENKVYELYDVNGRLLQRIQNSKSFQLDNWKYKWTILWIKEEGTGRKCKFLVTDRWIHIIEEEGDGGNLTQHEVVLS